MGKRFRIWNTVSNTESVNVSNNLDQTNFKEQFMSGILVEIETSNIAMGGVI